MMLIGCLLRHWSAILPSLFSGSYRKNPFRINLPSYNKGGWRCSTQLDPIPNSPSLSGLPAHAPQRGPRSALKPCSLFFLCRGDGEWYTSYWQNHKNLRRSLLLRRTEADRQTDRQTDKEPYKHRWRHSTTNRRTSDLFNERLGTNEERKLDRQTDNQTDRQTTTQTDEMQDADTRLAKANNKRQKKRKNRIFVARGATLPKTLLLGPNSEESARNRQKEWTKKSERRTEEKSE